MVRRGAREGEQEDHLVWVDGIAGVRGGDWWGAREGEQEDHLVWVDRIAGVRG